MSTSISQDSCTEIDQVLNGRDRDVLRIMDQVKGKFIRTQIDSRLYKEISRLIVQNLLRADLRKPSGEDNRREGRILVLTGFSGAGKSTSLIRALSRHPLLRRYSLDDPRSPVTFVRVTSPCTLKQLGRDTLKKLGYPLERDLKEHITWERARIRIAQSKKRILVFDEMQHITQTISINEQEKVSNTIKDLAINDEWRSSIIVCGLPEVANFVRRDKQLKRRAVFIETPRLKLPWDGPDVAEMIVGLARVAKLRCARHVETDMAPRLIHAAEYLLGLAIEITHDAIELALAPDYLGDEDEDEIAIGARPRKEESGILSLEHFARAFERRSGCSSEDNPFIAEDWMMTQAENGPDLNKPQTPRKAKGGVR